MRHPQQSDQLLWQVIKASKHLQAGETGMNPGGPTDHTLAQGLLAGGMMDRPLMIADVLVFASDVYGDGTITSRRVEGDLHTTTYADTRKRTEQLAKALKDLGIQPGERVATMAWNGYRHVELYYAVSGIGSVCHTINPRLSAEQIEFIVAHANDKALFVDLTFVPLIEKLVHRLPKELKIVILCGREHMPDTSIEGALCYEELLAAQDPGFAWPRFSENTASSLCYTSGTTGNPKGALYSHRSTVLHALMCAVAFQNALFPGSSVMPVVPMFHVNAWGSPYTAPLTGSNLVMPGPNLDGASLFSLMDEVGVYSAWGVPTVWLGLLEAIKAAGRPPMSFKDVVVGGSAAPRTMIEQFDDMGVSLCHAWGMTEMSPIGTQANLTPPLSELPKDQRFDLKVKQGRRTFGVEMKIVGEDGTRQPHDGQAMGELYVRGNSVIKEYYNNPEATAENFDDQGWFRTGDVATIDPLGFLQITDRAKDLIKSGGEWISSIDMESAALAHPQVANCAVIAIAHEKWDERPLLVVVPEPGETVDKDSVLALLQNSFAKWQLPDDVVSVEALPLTATGKVSKLTLRQQFQHHYADNN